MPDILRLGFLSVLLTLVTADFEYSAEVIAILPDAQNLSENDKLSVGYDLINHNSQVWLKKTAMAAMKGLYYQVQSEGTSKIPGIQVRASSSRQTGPQAIYYFSKLDFGIVHHGLDHQYMRLTLKFEDPVSKETVGIILYPFKPPKNEVDKNHLEDLRAPRVHSPISLPKVFKSSVESSHFSSRKSDDTQEHKFIGNVLLIKDIQERAKKIGRTKKRYASRYTNWYLAGSVVFEEEALDTILDWYNYESGK